MIPTEYNFDGIAGPLHNFSGLATGNPASDQNRYRTSSPRKAALQGLKKMQLLLQLTGRQGIIPPQERPDFFRLRQQGYSGTDRQILEKVGRDNFPLLLQCTSSSSMWAANAATVSPSADTADRRVHLTPANLRTHPHRALETRSTAAILQKIFPSPQIFVHHPAFEGHEFFQDEGAANHMRVCEGYGAGGLEIFVYGKKARLPEENLPHRYPPRQSYEASIENVARHRLAAERTIFVRQNPAAIDAGVFHNDVIAMSHENVVVYHETAFADREGFCREVAEKFVTLSAKPLTLLEISSRQLTVEEAVRSYFFNSQLVTLPDRRMALIAPLECREDKTVQTLIRHLLPENTPIQEVFYVDLTESMRNGGGPACLRLRVDLQPGEVGGVHPGFLLTGERISQLEDWVNRRYRKRLEVKDMKDFSLVEESRRALDELTQILGCGSVYDFQK